MPDDSCPWEAFSVSGSDADAEPAAESERPELPCSGFQPEADADHAATLSLAIRKAQRHADGTTAVDHEPAAESEPAAEAESF